MQHYKDDFKRLLNEIKSGEGIDEGAILLLDRMILQHPDLVRILKDEFTQLKDCSVKEVYAGRIVTHKLEEPYASYLRKNHDWEDDDFIDL